MAQRKVQQEMEKCFKKVDEGILAFDGLHEKIHQSASAPQREKLEDALKKEIKKLQRLRDQIKTWAAGSEVKDKKPLTDKRKAIEIQMEKFKAVEKEMKTKAFSKEGLAAAAKLDPREREKQELIEFVGTTIEELERQVESVEAEVESIQSNTKKGRKDSSKSEKQGELDYRIEQHRFHISKLEIIQRSLENSDQHQDAVKDLMEDIKYYVESNTEPEFIDNEDLYEDLNLEDEEQAFGIPADPDTKSSNDALSTQEELHEVDSHARSDSRNAKPKTGAATSDTTQPILIRRSSTATKSPAPHLAPLHPPLPQNSAAAIQNASASSQSGLKPAPPPATKTDGSARLAYSSAAALPTSSKAGIYGMEPLPSISSKDPKSSGDTASSSTEMASSALKSAQAASPADRDRVAYLASADKIDRENSQTPDLPTPPIQSTGSQELSPASEETAPRAALRAPPGLELPRSSEASLGLEVEDASSFTSTDLHRRHGSTRDQSRSSTQTRETDSTSLRDVLQVSGVANTGTSIPRAARTTAEEQGRGIGAGDLGGRAVFSASSYEQQQQPMKAPSTTRGGLARREQSFVVTSNGRRNDSSPSDNDALVLDSDTALDLDLMKHLLPPELHDLIGPFETMQKRLASRQGPNGSPTAPPDAHALEQLARSQANCPTAADGDKPFRHNRLARNPYRSPPWYPQQPLALFDDPAWYKTLETDTLFFIFYYRQGTYHQHLAAKALKAQSWRFHKRFQTWFQRHEEPKVIVEDYEQGTYRFFDYESTWMNRRKADFQFEYRYLEDELV